MGLLFVHLSVYCSEVAELLTFMHSQSTCRGAILITVCLDRSSWTVGFLSQTSW